MLQILIRNLHKHTPRLAQQLLRQQQPVAQVGQVGVNPQLPGVAESLDHLRFLGQVLVLAILDDARADEWLEVGAVLDAVGGGDVDHLHLPGHALLLQQRVHHQQRIAGHQPVGPAALVAVGKNLSSITGFAGGLGGRGGGWFGGGARSGRFLGRFLHLEAEFGGGTGKADRAATTSAAQENARLDQLLLHSFEFTGKELYSGGGSGMMEGLFQSMVADTAAIGWNLAQKQVDEGRRLAVHRSSSRQGTVETACRNQRNMASNVVGSTFWLKRKRSQRSR